MKAVIVQFEENKYSIKTKNRCYWCDGFYWDSIAKIYESLPGYDFNLEVIKAPKKGSSSEWQDIYERIKTILSL